MEEIHIKTIKSKFDPWEVGVDVDVGIDVGIRKRVGM